MNIKTLLSGIQKTSHTFDVTGLSLNTQNLQKGDIFVAYKGHKNMVLSLSKMQLIKAVSLYW